jgi:hypothetical protein
MIKGQTSLDAVEMTLIPGIPDEPSNKGFNCPSPSIPSPLFSIEIPKHVNYVIYWHAKVSAKPKPEKRPYVGDRHRLTAIGKFQ